MSSPSPRRRPPPAPRPDPSLPPKAGSRRPFAPNAFRGVLIAGAVLVVGVIVTALATGTADQLPWGAIIGVVAIMAFAFVAGRRRAREFGPEDDA